MLTKIITAIALLCSYSAGLAQHVPALTVDPDSLQDEFFSGSRGTYAWSFQVLSPTLVSAVGYYDSGKDGLFQPHQIDIWQATRPSTIPLDIAGAVNLFTTVIPAGEAATLEGPWRIMELAPKVTLEPGVYAISGSAEPLMTPDPVKTGYRFEFPTQVDPRIFLGMPGDAEAAYQAPGSGRWAWTLDYGAHMGPMFFIEVPEPSVFALWVLGGGVWLARRKRWTRFLQF